MSADFALDLPERCVQGFRPRIEERDFHTGSG